MRWLFFLMYRYQHKELRKMKKFGNMIQTKEQDKAPVTDPNEKKIYEFPDSVEGRKVKV